MPALLNSEGLNVEDNSMKSNTHRSILLLSLKVKVIAVTRLRQLVTNN